VLIVGLTALEATLKKHAAARRPVLRWVELTTAAEWNSIVDTRATFPTADAIKGTPFTCFNIGGNNYRLITVIDYPGKSVAIFELLTHAEYDRKY